MKQKMKRRDGFTTAATLSFSLGLLILFSGVPLLTQIRYRYITHSLETMSDIVRAEAALNRQIPFLSNTFENSYHSAGIDIRYATDDLMKKWGEKEIKRTEFESALNFTSIKDQGEFQTDKPYLWKVKSRCREIEVSAVILRDPVSPDSQNLRIIDYRINEIKE